MNLIIAGGGTGGHIFPGVAIGKEFEKCAKHPRVIFVGTPHGLEKDLVPKAGFSLFLIQVGGLKSKSLGKRLRSLVQLPMALIQSIRIVNSFAPDLVLGVGGYASGPVCVAAWLLGIPVVLQEQNTVPGFTNRTLGKIARRVYIAFEHAKGHFPAPKVVWTGNPIREDILAVDTHLNFAAGDPFTVLIFGGSQGASALNQGLIQALGHLNMPKSSIRFIHQTGPQDVEKVRVAYTEQGFNAEVSAFIDDMAGAYRRAHLVVARSGASILEIAATGRPSVLVPFPFAADNHQAINAEAFAQVGAAKVVKNQEFTGERCAAILNELFSDRAQLQQMAAATQKIAKRDAQQMIIKDCLEWLQHAR